jgi:hypothetical protein
LRVRLGDDARKLRGGFEQKHPGKKRMARKMTAQKGLISAHTVFANPALPRV